MAEYFGVIGNRDYIKLNGEPRPFWEFLDMQPDGWLTSLVYAREDLPQGKRMIWDCGAWSYRNDETPKIGTNEVTPEWTFERYQERAAPGDMIIAPDHMLIPGVNLDDRREFNRRSAQRFLDITAGLPFWPMATVHGQTLQERIDTARRYQDMGYSCLALGGLAARASQKALLLEIVAEIRRAVPDVWMHVLGLSSPDYAAAWQELGINSFDGSSHFKQAFTAGTFFTVSRDGKLKKHRAAKTERGNPDVLLAEIEAPLCNCKACRLLREDGIDTRTYGSNEHNMGRAAHNLNMLMIAQKIAMHGTAVLISCVGAKEADPTPAGQLYTSPWFRKARAWAKANGDAWYILSAEHGLLSPDKVIAPYEKTLNLMPQIERDICGQKVIEQIQRSIPGGKLIILAGRRYRDGITDRLVDLGYAIEVPMEGLGIGQQLAWLDSELTQQLHLF